MFVCRVGTTHCQLDKGPDNCVEFCGGRFTWLLGGHSPLRTDRRAASTYTTINSQELKASMLAATRILVSKLATARVFCYPPTTLPLPRRPHCQLGIYRCQRSQATRAATSPHRLRQWKNGRRLIDGMDHFDGLGFSYFSVLIRFSFSRIGYYLNVLLRFEKLGVVVG